ncbi:predicted protein [Histoplasma mississippiense (nom. inval.)]|uniref:predicted protein n=1 Tax=Ajellomyces capsulatus (strain NAm1 / WU24) TaxID=2059318 RepID=UPI000157CA36|nr:predicted protein [Histoplasma mississippiense (nom. inval.)]EDN09079.1 predicted protein [Histoplasma mississippiense (nom. inval.)]
MGDKFGTVQQGNRDVMHQNTLSPFMGLNKPVTALEMREDFGKKSAPAQVPRSPVVAISNNKGEVFINGATTTNSSLQVKGNRSRVVMRAHAMPLRIANQGVSDQVAFNIVLQHGNPHLKPRNFADCPRMRSKMR